MIEKGAVTITEDEAALYDRQIRLWGLDAQKRLRASHVLLAGVGGLGAEVVKNIVLSGINSLTLLDHKKVSELDSCCQFLADRDDVGKSRAEASLLRTQQLNPMVEVTADDGQLDDKDEEFFKKFQVVCVTNATWKQLTRVNDICHKNGTLFFAGDVFGFYGYMFADLGEHEYAEEVINKKPEVIKGQKSADVGSGEPAAKKSKMEEDITKTVKKTVSFTRLQTALDYDWGSEEAKLKLKRTPKTYFIIRVLQEFRAKMGRDPDPASRAADIQQLETLRESMASSLKLDEANIPQDFVHSCFAEMSPVCAVTGGILGQEVIKAVSQKDSPHNNFFFFNAMASTGMVDRIG